MRTTVQIAQDVTSLVAQSGRISEAANTIKDYGDWRVSEYMIEMQQRQMPETTLGIVGQKMAGRIAALEARVADLELEKARGIDIPKPPTKLEQVARACDEAAAFMHIGDGRIVLMDRTKVARAAIEALRMAPGRSAYGGAWHIPGELLNAYLDSILAEKQP